MGKKQGLAVSKTSIGSLLITPEQQRYITGKEKSELDKSLDDFRFANAIKNSLGRKIPVQEKGTVSMVSVADLLIAKRIAFLMENPDKIDLTEISKALGEQKNDKVDVNVNIKPQDIFSKVVNYQNGVIDVEPKERKA